jgi:tyrosyl-tRNA synthetase
VRSEQITQMKQDARSGKAHPMVLKRELARTIVADFHSAEAAAEAGEDWAKQFQKGGVPDNIESSEVRIDTIRAADVAPDHAVPEAGGPAIRIVGDARDRKNWVAIRVDKLVRQAGLATSNTDAVAKIKGKAVSINGTDLGEKDMVIICSQREVTLRVGRRMKRVHLVL